MEQIVPGSQTRLKRAGAAGGWGGEGGPRVEEVRLMLGVHVHIP